MYRKTSILIALIFCLALIFSCEGENKTPEPHRHDYSKAVILQDSTCTVYGVTEYYCECGAKITRAQDKLEHTWDNGKIIKESTVTEPGTKKFTCTVCGGTKEEELPLHVHAYEWTSAESSYFHSYQEYYQCACGDVQGSRQKEVLSLENSHWMGYASNTFNGEIVYEYYEITFLENGRANFMMGFYDRDTDRIGVQEKEVNFTLDEENMQLVFGDESGGMALKVMSESEGRIECRSRYNYGESDIQNPVLTPYDHEHYFNRDYLIPFDSAGHGYEATCTHAHGKKMVYIPENEEGVNPYHTFAFSGEHAGRCTECRYYVTFAMHFEFDSETMAALKNSTITIGDRVFMPTANPEGQCCNHDGINYATEEGKTFGHTDLFTCDTSGPWIIPEMKYVLEDGTEGTFAFYYPDIEKSGNIERYEAGDSFDITRFQLDKKDVHGNYIYWKEPRTSIGEEYKYGFRFIVKLN